MGQSDSLSHGIAADRTYSVHGPRPQRISCSSTVPTQGTAKQGLPDSRLSLFRAGPRGDETLRQVAAMALIASLGFFIAAEIRVSSQVMPPIVDLHFHPQPGWDLNALVSLMDQLGVARAGNGPAGPDSLGLGFAARYPNKFIPFCGLGEIIFHLQQGGPAAWDLQTDRMLAYLGRLEQGLRSKHCKGIGEVYPNNLRTHGSRTELRSRYPADSPLMRRLFAFSATFGVPLDVHMEADPPAVAELERLLESNARGTLVWAHCGNFAPTSLLKSMFQRHSNLLCDLVRQIAVGTELLPDWKDLLEELPDRFVLGTDLSEPNLNQYSGVIMYWRAILNQLTPQTVEKVAYKNAERIMNLPPLGR